MLSVESWLSSHNLPKPSMTGGRLGGDALRYALVTFLRRPQDLPEEVVVLLAENYFAKFYVDSGVT